MTPETDSHAYCEPCGEDVLVVEEACLFCGHPVDKRPSRKGEERVSAEHRHLDAERQAAIAERDPRVARIRELVLGASTPLLGHDEVAAWLIAREHHPTPELPAPPDPIAYLVPGTGWVQYCHSSAELEPLRELSDDLTDRFGWFPGEATTFLLTGYVPRGGAAVRSRVTIKLRPYGDAEPRIEVSDQLMNDGEAMANAQRAARARYGIGRRSKLAQRIRDVKLRRFVAEHGRGAKAHQRWNRENPDSRFASRQSYYRAAKRVTG